MKKKSRWAALVGVVCGAELIALMIGGAGLAALVSVEAAFVAVLLVGVTLWAVFDRRRRVLVPDETLNSKALQPDHEDVGTSL